MKSFQLAVLLAISIVTFNGCMLGPNARTGGLAGGLTGSAFGALAGLDSGRATEGAAIGALAGSALGNVLGDQVDQAQARQQYANQQYETQARRQAVTVEQVIEMSRSGLGDSIIANQIHNNGVLHTLTTQDLVALKNNGVSDAVIQAWQQTAPLGAAPARAPAPPVIVERWVDPCVPNVPLHFHCPSYRPYRRRPRASFHLKF